jgi:ribosomal protein uS17
MADDEKQIEETEAQVEEVSDTTETVDEAATVEEVSDTPPQAPAEEPAAEPEAEAQVEEATPEAPPAEAEAPVEEVSDTPLAEEAAPEAPPAKTKSLRHVPRSQRRHRSRPVREQPKTRKPITRTEKPESELGRRQERRGVVVSDKGDKTIVVKVDVIKSHPKYKKVVRRSVKFHAHDEENTAGVGDTVRIIETRPLSKQKRWRLAEVVEKAR